MSQLILFLIISLQIFSSLYCPFQPDDSFVYTIEGEEKSRNYDFNRTGFLKFIVSANNGTHIFFTEHKFEIVQGFTYDTSYYEEIDVLTYEIIAINTRQNRFGLYAWHWVNPSTCYLNATINVFTYEFTVKNKTFIPRINKTAWFLSHEIDTYGEGFEETSRVDLAYESSFGYLVYYQIFWQRKFHSNRQELEEWYSKYILWLNSTNATLIPITLSLFPLIITGSTLVLFLGCICVFFVLYLKKKEKIVDLKLFNNSKKKISSQIIRESVFQKYESPEKIFFR
ncbi:MAG: hypothetical protein ACFFBD_19820 [Candidatus Hodarchaeota archaeon]